MESFLVAWKAIVNYYVIPITVLKESEINRQSRKTIQLIGIKKKLQSKFFLPKVKYSFVGDVESLFFGHHLIEEFWVHGEIRQSGKEPTVTQTALSHIKPFQQKQHESYDCNMNPYMFLVLPRNAIDEEFRLFPSHCLADFTRPQPTDGFPSVKFVHWKFWILEKLSRTQQLCSRCEVVLPSERTKRIGINGPIETRIKRSGMSVLGPSVLFWKSGSDYYAT